MCWSEGVVPAGFGVSNGVVQLGAEMSWRGSGDEMEPQLGAE